MGEGFDGELFFLVLFSDVRTDGRPEFSLHHTRGELMDTPFGFALLMRAEESFFRTRRPREVQVGLPWSCFNTSFSEAPAAGS